MESVISAFVTTTDQSFNVPSSPIANIEPDVDAVSVVSASVVASAWAFKSEFSFSSSSTRAVRLSSSVELSGAVATGAAHPDRTMASNVKTNKMFFFICRTSQNI